jgi:hypothetical protein
MGYTEAATIPAGGLAPPQGESMPDGVRRFQLFQNDLRLAWRGGCRTSVCQRPNEGRFGGEGVGAPASKTPSEVGQVNLTPGWRLGP